MEGGPMIRPQWSLNPEQCRCLYVQQRSRCKVWGMSKSRTEVRKCRGEGLSVWGGIEVR